MADMDTKIGKRRNKRWPEALKREIVAASLAPGASVSVVARRYDVNANQVFGWRRLYGQQPGAPSLPSAPQLVPVTINPEPDAGDSAAPAPRSDRPSASRGRESAAPSSEAIEIEVSSTYRIRVGPSFDARALGRILDVLRK